MLADMGRHKGYERQGPRPLTTKAKENDVVFWNGNICVVQGIRKRSREEGGGTIIFLRYLGKTPPGKLPTWAVIK